MRGSRLLLFALLLLAGLPGSGAAQSPAAWVEAYRPAADSLIRAATRDSAAWLRVAELTDRFGPRFSGTPQL